jgi:hypothetical protein
MKKVFSQLMLATVLSLGFAGVVSLTGCGGGETTPTDVPPEQPDPAMETEEYKSGEASYQ